MSNLSNLKEAGSGLNDSVTRLANVSVAIGISQALVSFQDMESFFDKWRMGPSTPLATRDELRVQLEKYGALADVFPEQIFQPKAVGEDPTITFLRQLAKFAVVEPDIRTEELPFLPNVLRHYAESCLPNAGDDSRRWLVRNRLEIFNELAWWGNQESKYDSRTIPRKLRDRK